MDKVMQPKEVIAVFDNDEETFDRYTIILDPEYVEGWVYPYFGMSSNPTSPQGFSQFGEGCHYNPDDENGFLGKEIKFSDLPINVQEHIVYRLLEE